jgi:hypothetical protein
LRYINFFEGPGTIEGSYLLIKRGEDSTVSLGLFAARATSTIHGDDIVISTGALDVGVRDGIHRVAVTNAVDVVTTVAVVNSNRASSESAERHKTNGEEVGKVTHRGGGFDDDLPRQPVTRYRGKAVDEKAKE